MVESYGQSGVSSPGMTASAPVTGSQEKAGEKTDSVRLADSAKSEVCVCFEGPLGAHLKADI